MNRNELRVGDRLAYSDGVRVRPVEILDLTPIPGPHMGETVGLRGRKENSETGKPKRCFIKVRFLDNDEEGAVGTRGLKQAGAFPHTTPVRHTGETEKTGMVQIGETLNIRKRMEAGPGLDSDREYYTGPDPEEDVPPQASVSIRYDLVFRVPASKAGIIDTIIDILRGEGTLEVVGVGKG